MPRKMFKDRNLQKMYEICRAAATNPASEFFYAGKPRRGSATRSAYWNGRSGLKASWPRNSFAYACWCAGKDDLKAYGPVSGSQWW